MVYLGLIAITGVTIYFYWQTMPEISSGRRYALAALRWIALAVVMILLFNPIIRYSRNQPIQTRQLLLLDNSLSMEEKSGSEIKYQVYQEAEAQVKKLLQDKGYECETVTFADGIAGDQESSRLAKTMADLHDQDRLRNVKDIFLFSDGWFDDSDPEFIQNIQFPLQVYQTDFQAPDFDLQINRLKYNQRAWLKDLNPFIVDVSATNYNGKAEVDFYISEQKIQSSQLDFSQEKYQQIIFEHEFLTTGLQPIRVEVRSDSLEETETENNSFPGAVLVLEEKAAVKIISDRLSWEGRYLVQAAAREERFEVTYLQKDNELHKEREIVQMGAEIENCQVLCLVNYGKLSFSNAQIELIDRYVTNGGGLLYLGQPLPGLEGILPVRSTGIRREFEGKFRLTPESSNYQSFKVLKENLEEIPPVRFYYTELLRSGTLLADFPAEQTPPAIVFQEYGNGKVLYVSFLDLWKWQLWGEESHYEVFANNILQWLSYAKAENFFAWSEQNSYLLGEEAKINLAAFDEKYAPMSDLQAEIVISQDGQEYLRDFMNKANDNYNFSFTASEPGEYKYKIINTEGNQETEGKFLIESASSETRDRGTNSALLKFLAKQTNGKEFTRTEDFNDYPQAETAYKTTYHEIPLYKKWYVIAIFLLSFCLEIFFRKRWGLL
ncbi:MAG: hypothetical protein K9M99_07465 [Candidatus Cloacimonetes bacterium]|nr:hypothetical protein [Candidatus Cloacimonadota bacterium]